MRKNIIKNLIKKEYRNMKKYNKRYYWNESTLKLFRDLIDLGDDKEQVRKNVEFFVNKDCTLEENETEEMLINDLMNQIYDYVDGKQNPDSKKRIAREFKNTIASRVAKEVANHPQVTAKEGVTEWLWSTTKDMSIVKPYILLHVALTGKSLDTIIRKYEDMTKDHKESLKGN